MSANEKPRAIARLRVLSGSLQGAEYALSPGSTLLIMAGEKGLVAGAIPDFPDNSILLPCADGINVEVELGGGEGFRVRELDEPLRERDCRYQEVIRVRGLTFAVGRVNERWNPAIFKRSAPLGVSRIAPGAWRWSAVAACIMVLVIAVTGYCLSGQKEAADVIQLISGGEGAYRVVEGRDGHFHVFAQTERDASWARQSLARHGRSAEVKVSVQHREEVRLSHLLTEQFPGIRHHRIRLDDPRNPLLALSLERTDLDEHATKAVIGSLMRWMPYARSVVVDNWSDQLIDTRARQGLERLGVSFSRKTGDAVTYSVSGNLDDARLAAVREFMAGFYRRYGSNYVHFSVELLHDDFKGKSFGYGRRHYVKQTSGHWKFF